MGIAVLIPFPAPTATPVTPAAAPSAIAYKVYDTDASTLLATLTQWFDDTTVDTYNEVGHGSLKLQNDDSQLATCTAGKVIRKYVDSTAAFQFVVDRHVRRALDPAEEANHYTELSGDGIGQVLARAVVKPTLGYDKVPWGTSRTFSFASPEFDASAWTTATAIVAHQSDASTFYDGKPSGWCTPNATLIGPADGDSTQGYVGNWYVIGDHTFGADTGIVGFFAADNKAWVYANGFALTTFGTDVAFDQTHRATMFQSAGSLRVAAKVANFVDGGADPGPGRGALIVGNPTMFLSAVYPVDGKGQLGSLAIQTDTAWKILAYPDNPPGWTVGAVMNLLLTEAQADGLLTGVTWDFTGTNDSAGNPWDTQETITMNVGDDYLTVLRAFAGVYCDWAFAPDSLKLSMWRFRERGTVKTVAYTVGTNLTSLTHDAVEVGTDTLLVTWSGGQFRYPATGGTRLARFDAGNARSKAEATMLAAQQLALFGGTVTQFAGGIEPVGTADQPYTGPVVGDIVSVPDSTGAASAQRIVQIVGKTDDTGFPVWSPTFKDIHLDINARLALNAKRMTPGGLGGNSTVASPAGPSPQFGSNITTSEVSFSCPDPVATGVATKDKVPHESGNLYAVAVTAKTAGSTATTFTFLLDGNDVLGGTGSLPAGSQFHLFPVSYAGQNAAWVQGNSSKLTVNITGVGTGVAGLLIEPRFL